MSEMEPLHRLVTHGDSGQQRLRDAKTMPFLVGSREQVISPSASPSPPPARVVYISGGRLSFDGYRKSGALRKTAETEGVVSPTSCTPVVCSICRDVGYVRVDVPLGHPDFGRAIMCSCKKTERANTLFCGAHIPDDFQQCSFESYLQLSLSSEQEQAAVQAIGFALSRLQGYAGKKRGLYLYGNWGTGKTGLAISVLRQALANGKSGLYLPTSELFKMLYASIAASQRLAHGYGEEMDKEDASVGKKLLSFVESVEWLVLDDLGVECGTEYVVNQLYNLIEGRRSRRNLYTIFTSNKDAEGLEQRWRTRKAGGAAFDDCYRVIERLGEYCLVVPVSGRNLRERE